MAVVKFSTFAFPIRTALLWGCVAYATLFTSPSFAADALPPPSYSEKTGEALAKLQPLLTAKNWDGAQSLLDGIIASAPADSYDRAVATEIKAKIYL